MGQWVDYRCRIRFGNSSSALGASVRVWSVSIFCSACFLPVFLCLHLFCSGQHSWLRFTFSLALLKGTYFLAAIPLGPWTIFHFSIVQVNFFLWIQFHSTFSISSKVLPYNVCYYCILLILERRTSRFMWVRVKIERECWVFISAYGPGSERR